MPLFRRRREQWDPPEPRCAFLIACAEDPAGLLEELDVPAAVDASVHPAGEGVGLPSDLWEAMGVDDELRRRLEAARYQVGLMLARPGGDMGHAVLEVTRLADLVAERADGAVTDLAGQRMYAPGDWRVEDPVGELDAREHVNLHFVEGGAAAWVHTHGLAKFGRPELEVFDVPGDDVKLAALALLEIGQYTMEGALIAPGQTVGAPDAALRAKAGEREPEHWGDFVVLELVDETGNGIRALSGG